jgi:hypothetical protein
VKKDYENPNSILDRVRPAGSFDNNQGDKKNVKCVHYPKCRFSDDECPYIHPTEECPFFPECKFADKCMYIHPDVTSPP